MAKNKRGEGDMMKVLVWVIILGVLAYMFIPSVQTLINGIGNKGTNNGGSSGGTSVLTDESVKNCPTTGKTSYTLNVQDELATTATNVDAGYFVFNGHGLIKEGTTGSDGTDTFDVTCGKDYTIIIVNTTATAGTGTYAKTIPIQARIAADTINAEQTVVGTVNIVGIENPADKSRNPNVTLVAGATKNFDLKFVANGTARGFNRPLIMCQVNISAITDVKIGTFSDGTNVVSGTLPSRVSPTSGYKYYVFEYPKMLTPGMGVITASGSITAGSNTPSISDLMNCTIADQATWKTASYKTAETVDDAFKTGAENTENQANVGGPDSNIQSYYYVSNGGY